MRRLQLLFVWALMLLCGVQVAKAQKVGIFVEKETGLDDDEQAALEWFKTTYSDGIVYTPSTINDLSIDAVKALWIPIDREGLIVGWKNLPLSTDEIINKLKDYVKNGGNLLLTNHATQLVVALERIPNAYAPTIFVSGSGDNNPDTWGINAMIGCNPDFPNHYDRSSHAIYQGLEANDKQYTDHSFFPLIGSGWKENHNCMWDFNGIAGLEDNPNKLVDFENKTNSSVIGTWQHVTDYACAGVIEFKPNGDFKGTILCNGIAAYEWKQNNDVTNFYQDNIKRLTSNSLDYLKGLGNTLASTKAPVTVDGKASYWGTFYSSKDKTLPTGVTAYIVTSTTNQSAKLEKVAENGQVIPGENAYLLSTKEKQDEMYLTDAVDQAVAIPSGNLLKGSDEEQTITDANYTYYILGKQGDNYGFYWQADSENGSKVTNAAHKAYLRIQKPTDGSEAKFLSFTFGGSTTEIKGIATEQAQQEGLLYNLAGQRIDNGYKGLVIKNGKKFMAK